MDPAFSELLHEVRALRIAFESQADPLRPMTREAAAEYLGVHPDTLYRWACEGVVAHSRLGESDRGPMRFTKRDLDDAVARGRIRAAAD